MIIKIKKNGFLLLILTVIVIMNINIFPCNAGAREAAEYLTNKKEDFHEIISTVSTAKENFPARFDLREKGVVTPVKNQAPFGTCWGFSAISSAETSILSKLGKTYDETKLDLSEHHLAYFLNTYINDGSDQDGEGMHLLYEEDDEDKFNTGAYAYTATSIFSSGIGPFPEKVIPYRGKNSLTDSYEWENYNYSSKDDWSIPEEYRYGQMYELEESNILSSPAVYDSGLSEDMSDTRERNKHYIGYSQDATDEMKRQLMSGKAISVGFAADTSYPGRFTNIKGIYINTDNWCHYAYDSAQSSHSVSIVGWDDNIKRTDFLDQSLVRNGDGTPHYPEGDGAWIVKNSWGSELEEFPNNNAWGLKDENGKQTGYFYISYYDRSFQNPETFDFNVDEKNSYAVDQHDLMPSNMPSGWVSLKNMNMANVFETAHDQKLRAVSIQTDVKDADVTFDIYLLNDNHKDPTDGTLLTSETVHYAHRGYHRYTLKDKHDIKKGQKYSVVVTIKTIREDKTYYAIASNISFSKEKVLKDNKEEFDKMKPGKIDNAYFFKYYCKGIINKGESYINSDEFGGWVDFSDVVKEFKNVDENAIYVEYDNLPIKGYSDLASAEDLAKIDVQPQELSFAEPATWLNYDWCINRGLKILGIVAIIFLLLLICIHAHNKIKKLKIRISELEKDIDKSSNLL